MNHTDRKRLLRLGAGDAISDICRADGLTRSEFDAWWSEQTRARLPRMAGTLTAAALSGSVEINRDDWGVPHIIADRDYDLFFGYGYATAQDRLWQMDYYRRRAQGRLAEVVGPSGVESDVVSRTVGLMDTASSNLARFPAKTRRRLEAYAAGVNELARQCAQNLPIEFDLLGYRPDEWTPLDSVGVWQEFRWYLTGRLPVIAIPHLIKRRLGDGPLLDAFITGEAEEESIIPPGSYPPAGEGSRRVGEALADPDEGIGSNNWVVAGSKSQSGAPMVASDPHIAFGAVSCWFEAHLSGPEFNAAGAGYVGVPGVVFGRNETLAWGVTNNICSQRDIYEERECPERPGEFLRGDAWLPAKQTTERIRVRGEDDRVIAITTTTNGPIIDALLPAPLRSDRKASLQWLGTSFGDEITCMLNLAAARDCAEAREALRDWIVPTWSYVFGDTDGHIGYQAVGRIPIRERWNREYRPGWDAVHDWREVIPYDAMPALSDPAEGYARSANNRGAPPDFPYPLSGTWSSGYRAKRIREMLESRDVFSREDFAAMQCDTLSMRAVEALPGLKAALRRSLDANARQAADILEAWNGRMDVDEAGATLFEFFFAEWSRAIARERFSDAEAALVAGAISGFATRLLAEDQFGYWGSTTRERAILDSMETAMARIVRRLGDDPSAWQWGNIHKITLNHLLADRGDLSDLLRRGGEPVGGNGVTVCNTGFDPNYLASIGANWRHNADLADDPPGIWAVDASGQSGHPGSPHYGDQLAMWLAGEHRYVPLDIARSRAHAAATLTLRSA